MYDVAIIGGGPAGLAAALAFGRSRKRVALVDGGPPRNARAQYIGGFITQDRIAPSVFRATAHDDLRAYPTVDLHLNALVTRLERAGHGFTFYLGDTALAARRVLLTTGLIDEPLPLEGSRALWGRELFQCPYCHAYEHRDRRLGYLAATPELCAWAVVLRSWSRDVVVFTNGAFAVPAEIRRAVGPIPIEEHRITALVHTGEQLRALRLDGGREVACDALFFRPVQRHVPLVAGLGLALTADGYVRVDAQFQTSLPGVYAAGDLATHYHGALVAAAAGSQAAHCINHELTAALVGQGQL